MPAVPPPAQSLPGQSLPGQSLPGQSLPTVDPDAALDRLRQLVSIPTISRLESRETRWEHFEDFITALPGLYPHAHRALEREIIGGHALLYRWPGRGSGDPTVLMSHYDVVSATDEGWRHPPFAAEVTGSGDDRVLWGRGTLDDKGSLAAILEAVEAAVLAGFAPANDLYLSFGCDEETTGLSALAIVQHLQAQGIRPALVLDEGGAVVEGIFPGVHEPIAVVGVSEKGIMSVVLRVDQCGGHASTPPRWTATARLARAITRLSARPFPASLSDANLEMIRTLGAHSSGAKRWVFRHARWFRLLLVRVFAGLSDETNAMVRTTAAVTQLSGSQAINALPEQARAVVNVRIAVGSSVEATLRHVRRAIHDPLVTIEPLLPNEPSPVSPTSGPAWEHLRRAIRGAYPAAIVTPYIMLAASDSRRFTAISNHVYRFTPFEMSAAERGALHARDERMRVDTYLHGIGFYQRLIALR